MRAEFLGSRELTTERQENDLESKETEGLLREENGLGAMFRGRVGRLARVFSMVSALAIGGEMVETGNAEVAGGTAEVKVEKETRHRERVRHISGNTYEWQGKRDINGLLDYYPSSRNSLFDTLELQKGPGVSGDFREELRIVNEFGVFAETVEAAQVDSLIQQYDSQVSRGEEFRNVLRQIARDRFVFIAVQDFLENGGELNARTTVRQSGRYNGNPLYIDIGITEEKLETGGILYHELLHYIFDKKDSILFESYDTGGADHHAIDPLEDRFYIIQSIRAGLAPLYTGIDPLYGFTMEGKLGEEMKFAIDSDNLNQLRQIVESDTFLSTYVHAGMVMPLSSNKYDSSHRDIFGPNLTDGRWVMIKENRGLAADDTESGEKGITIFTRDVNGFDLERFLAGPGILETDKEKIRRFVQECQHNPEKGRGYILTEDQLQDIAYLNAYNGSILQQAFRMAIVISGRLGRPIQEVFAHPAYREGFGQFLKQLAARLEQESNSSVNHTAFEIMNSMIGIERSDK